METIGGFNKNREYDMRGIMVPLIGDLLYYDTQDMLVIILEVDDLRFYDERFIPVGVIIGISEDKKELKLLTPYFIQVNFDLKERISEKNMIKQLKSFVRAYTKDFFKDEIEDLKFNLTTTDDLKLIILNSDKAIHGLDIITKDINDVKEDLKNIISYGTLVYVDKDELNLAIKLQDDFNEIVFDENFNAAIHNSVNILDLKKQSENTDVLSYVIPISTIILD